MKLNVYAGFGASKKVITESVTTDQIVQTMNSIDWNNFHQVVLEMNNDNWIEVGGSLKEDGLSVVHAENGQQKIIINPPASVDQMIRILVSYYSGDGLFLIENKFQ